MLSKNASELLAHLKKLYEATGKRDFDSIDYLEFEPSEKSLIELHNNGYILYNNNICGHITLEKI